jgi:hypothetical protein
MEGSCVLCELLMSANEEKKPLGRIILKLLLKK